MPNPDTLLGRLTTLVRRELAGELERICDAVEADESSLLVPSGEAQLVFLTSTNPVLAGGTAPPVPVGASFTGLAFSTGQAIALADAAHQPGHFATVDAILDRPTREFAAMPVLDRSGTAVGVLTLANRRPAPARRAGQPFSLAELSEAGRRGRDLGRILVLLAGLEADGTDEADAAAAFGATFAALAPRDRRAVQAVAAALADVGGSRHDAH